MMTSRERLLKALAIEEPDRVPISCYELTGWDEDSWYRRQPSYNNLIGFIRENTDCIYMVSLPGWQAGEFEDPRRQEDACERQERTACSVQVEQWREGKSAFTRTTFHTPKGPLTRLHRRDDDVFTTWTLEHLLKDIDDIDKYLAIGWEIPKMDLTNLADTQRRLGERGIVMPEMPDPICLSAELFEMGQFLVYALTDTDRILYLHDAIHERNMARLRTIIESGTQAGVNFDEVLFRICGPEYATPPYLPPEMFARLVTPYVKEMAATMHDCGAKARVHSHGKIAKVLDEIMKTEPDALDPIEPPPDGDITLGEVKKRIGDRVCLFGNIELKLLEQGTTEQVRSFVIDAMNQAKPGGGYVILPTAAPINVPLSPKTEANYRTFIETALEIGEY